MSPLVKVVVLMLGLLPASRIKNVLLRRCGWRIGRGVSIAPIVAMGASSVVLEERSRIGAFNIIRGLVHLELHAGARIGQWNWITAAAALVRAGAPASLILAENSAVTSRHYIDASGGVSIGRFTTVAGVRSTFITHGINWRLSAQSYRSITIGEYCLISSNVNVAPGAQIADQVVIGMGATVSGILSEAGLYVAPRASLVKPALEGHYFSRDAGFISDVVRENGSL